MKFHLALRQFQIEIEKEYGTEMPVVKVAIPRSLFNRVLAELWEEHLKYGNLLGQNVISEPSIFNTKIYARDREGSF